MKIISYNVNGIRAAMKKGLADWLNISQPDILCLQETKASPDQVDVSQFEKLAVAINTGTNIPSVATPNGQAAFLFLLTSSI